MHEDIAKLKQEISRLTKVIDILLNKNEELEQIIAGYQNVEKAICISGELTAGSMEDQKDFFIALQKDEGYKKEFFTSLQKDDLYEKLFFTCSQKNEVYEKEFLTSSQKNDLYEKLFFIPSLKTEIGKKLFFIPLQKNDIGKKVFFDASQNFEVGKKNPDSLSANDMVGKNNVSNTIPNNKQGNNGCNMAEPAAMQGMNYKKNDQSATAVNGNIIGNDNRHGVSSAPSFCPQSLTNEEALTTNANVLTEKESLLSALADEQPVSEEEAREICMDNLMLLLRDVMVRSTDSGLKNTAAIILRLEQTPRQSLRDLQKLTNLSPDGIGKRVVAMKRCGLVTRAPGRQLLLTGIARQMLEDARE